jgi:hypothetical protein
MKFKNKIASGLLVLVIAFFGMLQTQAQVSFRPGFRGGANFSHFTKGNNYYADPYDTSNPGNSNIQYDTKTDFYLGFFGALKLTKYYTLQPEIDYSAQGSNYRSGTNNSISLDVDYLSFSVMNNFTFNDRFNMHFGPTLDFVTNKNFNTETNFDMAFVFGMGINLTRNFGIEGRVKKGIIPVVDFNDNHTNVVFSVGGTYTFDVK